MQNLNTSYIHFKISPNLFLPYLVVSLLYMKTEKQLVIEKARPISMAKGLNIAQFKLITLLFEGNNTKQIAVVWGPQYNDVMIRDEVSKIYNQLEKSRPQTHEKINSHIRILIAIGLITS